MKPFLRLYRNPWFLAAILILGCLQFAFAWRKVLHSRVEKGERQRQVYTLVQADMRHRIALEEAIQAFQAAASPENRERATATLQEATRSAWQARLLAGESLDLLPEPYRETIRAYAAKIESRITVARTTTERFPDWKPLTEELNRPFEQALDKP